MSLISFAGPYSRVSLQGRAYKGGSSQERPEGKRVVEQGPPCTAQPYRADPCRSRPCRAGSGEASGVAGQILFSLWNYSCIERWKSFPFTISLLVQDSESGLCSVLGWEQNEDPLGLEGV